MAVQVSSPAGSRRDSSVLVATQIEAFGKTRAIKLEATPVNIHPEITWLMVSTCGWNGHDPPSLSQLFSRDPTANLRHKTTLIKWRMLQGDDNLLKAAQTSIGCLAGAFSAVARC